MFTLDSVVPWGRSFDEYRHMFHLTEVDLGLRILGCADGPASFNAEATSRGHRVTSCDPLYRWDTEEIRARIAATSDVILQQTSRNAHEFVWSTIHSVDELREIRMSSMDCFLNDLKAGTREGRYVDAELPTLPFRDQSFDIALCSHFLFLYSEQLNEQFHLAAVREMCRVAREVRLFPLVALGGRPSTHVEVVRSALRGDGYDATVVTVPYEFQRGGNEMLRIVPRAFADDSARAHASWSTS